MEDAHRSIVPRVPIKIEQYYRTQGATLGAQLRRARHIIAQSFPMLSFRIARRVFPHVRSARKIRGHGGLNLSRSLCSAGDDGDGKQAGKFDWMDEAIVSSEVHETSGFIELDADHWREFEEKSFITETDVTEERLHAMESGSNAAPMISDEFLKGMFELESEDLLDILEIDKEEDARITKEMEEVDPEKAFMESIPAPTMSLEEAQARVFAEETEKERKRLAELASETDQAPEKESRGLQFLGDAPGKMEDVDAVLPPSLSKLPENAKRPGYERRVMQMESEMGRIVTETLAHRHPEWDASRAGIVEVALSSNMRDLTVFYELPNEVSRGKEWKNVLKRVTKGVRGEIAKLDIRYAPRVHFQNGQGEGKADQAAELDDIFAQIAVEKQSAT